MSTTARRSLSGNHPPAPTAMATSFPPVLLKIDPDWCECQGLWQSPEDAKTTADDLSADLGWEVGVDDLYEYKLVLALSVVASYYCSFTGETVLLKAKDAHTFVETEAQL